MSRGKSDPSEGDRIVIEAVRLSPAPAEAAARPSAADNTKAGTGLRVNMMMRFSHRPGSTARQRKDRIEILRLPHP